MPSVLPCFISHVWCYRLLCLFLAKEKTIQLPFGLLHASGFYK